MASSSSSSSSPSLSPSLHRMFVLCAALRMVPKWVEEKTLEEFSRVNCFVQPGKVGVDRVELGVVTRCGFLLRASSRGISPASVLIWLPFRCAKFGSCSRVEESLESEWEIGRIMLALVSMWLG